MHVKVIIFSELSFTVLSELMIHWKLLCNTICMMSFAIPSQNMFGQAQFQHDSLKI